MTNANQAMPNTYHQGYCYFDVTTGKFWIDTKDNDSTGRLAIHSSFYGVCETAAGTAQKQVSCPGFVPSPGAIIFIKFKYTNTAALNEISLKINNEDAALILNNGLGLSSPHQLVANKIYCFIFDMITVDNQQVPSYSLVNSIDSGTVTSVAAGAGLNTISADNNVDGGSITTTGTLYLTKSGVNPGSYGSSADVTGNNNTVLKVPYITVDKYGRVTSIQEINYTSKNSTYTVGNKALKVSSNTGTATQAITVNESSADRTLAINGDGTYITGAVSGSDNAAVVTLSHADPTADETSKLTANASGATAAWSIDVVKGITVNRDAKGHVTGISVTSGKIPANPNTDTKVTQTNQTASNDYRLLLSGTADDTTRAEGANKSANLKFNPSTKVLTVGGDITATGNLSITGTSTLSGEVSADSITVGDLISTGGASFTQSPTAPTPDATSNDTTVATTAFVKSAFATNDAMVFKGTVAGSSSSPGGFTIAANRGDTYKVSTAGYVNGVKVEVGDTFICTTDGTAAATSSNYSTIQANWVVLQTNIDGYVIGPASSTAGKVAVFSDGSGKLLKQGTIATETVIKTVTLSGGAAPTLGTAIAADDITDWDAGSTPTLGTAFTVPNVTGNSSVTASKVTKTDNTVVKTISQAESTSSIIGTVIDGVLTFIQAVTAVGAVTAGSTATASAVTISDVTATKVTLGTAFTIPNVTGVGSVPSLSYTARSIPNVTNAGSSASLSTTTQTVVTGIS